MEEPTKNDKVSEDEIIAVPEKLDQDKEVDKLIKIAEIAEKRVLAIKKIKQQALKLTDHRDWININGKPYLQTSGAEKISSAFGISYRFLEDPKRVEEENGFRYEVKMEFVMGERKIEAIGSRSTKDGFFTTRYSKKGEKYQLPASEIDSGDVLKAAITNAVGIGITRILGIRNLTWEDLEEAGINISDLAGVEYKKPQKEEKGLPEKKPYKPPYDFLQKMAAAKRSIKELTGSTEAYYEVLAHYGYLHADEVRAEDIDDVYRTMKEKFMEIKKKKGE